MVCETPRPSAVLPAKQRERWKEGKVRIYMGGRERREEGKGGDPCAKVAIKWNIIIGGRWQAIILTTPKRVERRMSSQGGSKGALGSKRRRPRPSSRANGTHEHEAEVVAHEVVVLLNFEGADALPCEVLGVLQGLLVAILDEGSDDLRHPGTVATCSKRPSRTAARAGAGAALGL